MELNAAVIPHFQCTSIPIYKLKQLLSISEEYLKEKSTWYVIEQKLKYFKIRNDYRLFTEQFFSEFGRQVIGLDTIDYQIASLRISDETHSKKTEKMGLLSNNFQDGNHNYYLISELLNSEISDLICYSGYSLSNLLRFFKEILSENDYEKNKDFLIRLFISDAFMLQSDRNYHNIGFEIPKIDGISYKQRLRPNVLQDNPQAKPFITIENGSSKLVDLTPTKVYDSEKILGIDHKNTLSYKEDTVWCPLFPYSNDLLFETQEKANAISNSLYDGFDPNLTELYMNHPKESKPLIERLAYDDEYKKILENFSKKNSQIHLLPETKDYVVHALEGRRKEFQKVLKL